MFKVCACFINVEISKILDFFIPLIDIWYTVGKFRVFKYWNHRFWLLLVCCVLYPRCVLEVPAIYWPTAVFEIQHLRPERCSCWGVRTQRPTALTHTGWLHKHMHAHLFVELEQTTREFIENKLLQKQFGPDMRGLYHGQYSTDRNLMATDKLGGCNSTRLKVLIINSTEQGEQNQFNNPLNSVKVVEEILCVRKKNMIWAQSFTDGRAAPESTAK